MANFKKRTNYREQYPDLSEEIIEVLQKSDRKMEYQQYDLKIEKYRIDPAKRTVTYLPSKEDSFDRLLEENRQFVSEAEGVAEVAVKDVMIEIMRNCIKLLSSEEQELIAELFFLGKSEQEYGNRIGISQKGVNKRKYKILGKLKKMMKI
jgi:RNA polymerase sigma factor (sigma-70 family)